MAAVTTAVAAAVAAATGVYGAVQGGREARKGRKAASAAAAADREFNYLMFLEGRGAEGSAKLPMYMKDSRGRLIEPIAGTQAADVFSLPLDRTPRERLDEYEGIYAKEEPLRQQGMDTLRGIYSGIGGVSDYERRRMGNLAPITEAEQAQARTIGESAELALAQQLNQQRAMDARAGIGGRANLGASLLGASIRQNAAMQQADALARADLDAARRNAAISEDAYQMQLDNPQLADSIAAMQIASKQRPYEALIQQTGQQYEALRPFEIMPGNFQSPRLPAPGVNTTGSSIAGGLAGAANVAGQYARNQQMMELMQQQNQFAQWNQMNNTIDWNQAAINTPQAPPVTPGTAPQGPIV